MARLVVLWLATLLFSACSAPELDQSAAASAEPPEFALQQLAPGVFSGWHADMALHATFARGRVSIVPESGVLGDSGVTQDDKPIDLSVTAWGCERELSEVPSTEPVSRDGGAGVSYRHQGFDEWYTLGRAGLEQGFTIRELPDCARQSGHLSLRFRFYELAGAVAQLSADGAEAVLSTPGHRAVHYGQLRASDAAGTEHAVRISAGSSLGLEVDVANATLPLTIDPLIWDAQQRILPSDFKPTSFWPNDFFGRSLAVFGDTALIGADSDDDLGSDSGAVYVFTREAPTEAGLRARWLPQQKLKANDAAAGAHFGSSVTLFDDTALIGASGANGRGAAYVFVRSGSNAWTLQQRLAPSDLSLGAHFGSSVALSGDNAIVGASLQNGATNAELGAAYAFGRTGSVWSQLAVLTPPAGDQATALHFGAAVAIAGNTAAIGRDNAGAGGVDWYSRVAETWTRTGTGVRSNVAHFGSALAMTEAFTAIGAYGDATKGLNAGAVSVTSTSAPHALLQLTASDARVGDQFGFSLAISGNTLVVGAPSVDGAPGSGGCGSVPDTGAAYVFGLNGSTWSQQKKLIAVGLTANAPPLPACDPGMQMGSTVAVTGQLTLLGAPARTWATGVFPNVGGVYDYEAALTNGSTCNLASDCFSARCVEGVCCNAACDGPCLSCSAALKDPAHGFNGDWVNGICGEITADTDPKNGCNDMGTTCGTLGECSGYGSCKAANPPGTVCGVGASSFCVGPTSAAANSVCVNYTCASFLSYDCEPGFLCKNGACVNSCKSNADCNAALGFVCKSGLCKLGTALGAACTKNNECPTNHCVDDVCCESSCDEACLTCALPGSEGTCLPVIDDPGDPAGSCLAEGGSAGETGAAGRPPTGDGGAAGDPTAGIGGELAGGASGAGGENGGAELAGSAGKDNAAVECVPACVRGMVCNHHDGTCNDELVTACGCRQVGGGHSPASPLTLLLLLATGLARRRSTRAK